MLLATNLNMIYRYKTYITIWRSTLRFRRADRNFLLTRKNNNLSNLLLRARTKKIAGTLKWWFAFTTKVPRHYTKCSLTIIMWNPTQQMHSYNNVDALTYGLQIGVCHNEPMTMQTWIDSECRRNSSDAVRRSICTPIYLSA